MVAFWPSSSAVAIAVRPVNVSSDSSPTAMTARVGDPAVEPQASLVRKIFAVYTEQRLGTRALANLLNEQGVRTERGKLWSGNSIQAVLENPVYIGEIRWRGERIPAMHAPLVSRELFEQAQTLLKERGRQRSKRRSNPSDYLLSGVARCGWCGSAMVGSAAHGRNGRYRYYTPASAATGTARRRAATANASPPTSSNSSCSPSSPAASPTPGCSRKRSSARASSPPAVSPRSKPKPTGSTAGTASWREHATATCRRSSAAPCPKRHAANASARSPTNSTN